MRSVVNMVAPESVSTCSKLLTMARSSSSVRVGSVMKTVSYVRTKAPPHGVTAPGRRGAGSKECGIREAENLPEAELARHTLIPNKKEQARTAMSGGH